MRIETSGGASRRIVARVTIELVDAILVTIAVGGYAELLMREITNICDKATLLFGQSFFFPVFEDSSYVMKN